MVKKAIQILKRELDPFRRPWEKTRRDYIWVYGLFALIGAGAVLAYVISIINRQS